MATAEINGLTINYECRGSGEPLLLIMGLGGQLTDWPPSLIDLLADRFQLVLLDNRDAGLSSTVDASPPGFWFNLWGALTGRQPKAAYRLADMADDAIGLLDHLGIGRAQVVGVSMGAMIAQQVAIDHPERIAGLVSIMSTTGNRKVGQPAPSLIRRLALRRPPPVESPVEEIIEAAVDLYVAVSGPARDVEGFRELARASIERSYRPDGTARQLAAIQASPDRTAELGRVTVPTLVIHGQADPLVRLSGGLATSRAVPGSRLVVFPEMGHDLPAARHGELVELMVDNASRSTRGLG